MQAIKRRPLQNDEDLLAITNLINACNEVDKLDDGVDLHNNSFIDHWNFHPVTVEMLKHWLQESSYRRDLDLVAVTADNTFVAQCYCHINPESNVRTKRNEGNVGILGVRRGFRKIGLG
ncbi:hypothetical protein DSM106972_010310 [Dulcicalothrix desertica PCC 7102]|uniref:N-acetyltransferase domain-containing protein n=1 Tax=Dulcicalothrix desertica PCC 7102 TaxID=232991 RepID=A0A3S1ATL2_9CYAN|nr:hypothetical protein [Dulcicalothrix desertica]RUT08978.1 hypothetical protein DSM106972_010310 [Dulcicalothrix desertica PCC 7102]